MWALVVVGYSARTDRGQAHHLSDIGTHTCTRISVGGSGVQDDSDFRYPGCDSRDGEDV
jgi:hypothetical protein